MKRMGRYAEPVVIAGCCAAVGGMLLMKTVFAAGDLTSDRFNMGLAPDAKKGYELLLNAPMASPVLKEADIDRLWLTWEPELKAIAEKASPAERHRMTFDRYGWDERTDDNTGLPLGYTRDGKGSLVTNCFVCHGGTVAGKTTPGAGNSQIDLTSLATDVRKLGAIDTGKDPNEISDVQAPFQTPLSIHKGTTNAVIFAAVFAGLRDPKLGMEYTKHPEMLMHHDMNPPAWWNFKHKEKIYCDAFAPKTPRQLMPFAMSPLFSNEQFYSFEPNFVHIKAYIESLEAPKYPFPIDRDLAKLGEVAFNRVCVDCHGTYGPGGKFPNKSVEIEKIGTDPRRWQSISREARERANASWLQYNGEVLLDLESKGYLAQPLDGIWASAPYFHNGSVPTVWHVFNVDERPKVWKRASASEYDQKRMGLQVEEFSAVPDGLNSREARYYYDTATPGSAATGHPFPDEELSADEKTAVMEYLKTL